MGLYRGTIGDNGKANGNYCIISLCPGMDDQTSYNLFFYISAALSLACASVVALLRRQSGWIPGRGAAEEFEFLPLVHQQYMPDSLVIIGAHPFLNSIARRHYHKRSRSSSFLASYPDMGAYLILPQYNSFHFFHYTNITTIYVFTF